MPAESFLPQRDFRQHRRGLAGHPAAAVIDADRGTGAKALPTREHG
jgi:hypothetical protein